MSPLSPGARITTWNDDSGNAKHGTTDGNFNGMEYQSAGFGGGAAPYAQSKTSDYGNISPSSHSSAETDYLLLSDMVGAGSGLSASRLFCFPGGGGQNCAVYLQASGILYFHAGGSAFGTPQAAGTTVLGSGAYILRVTHTPAAGNAKLFVNGVLEISLSDALIVNGWTGSMLLGPAASDTNKFTARWHRVTRYTSAHVTAGLNAIEMAMIAAAGL
jgi:hypothetical protein